MKRFPQHHEDKALAKRVAKGDEQAFRAFFNDYYPRVYRFCVRRLDEHWAEDAAQAVLVQAIQGIKHYRGEAALFTWLCQIARHEISAHYRRNEKHRHLVLIEDDATVRAELESIEADPMLSPEGISSQAERQQLIQLILDSLPGQHGSVLEWKYMEGLSVKEIAARLDTTASAVQSTLARARNSFQRQYTVMRTAMTTEGDVQALELPSGGHENDS